MPDIYRVLLHGAPVAYVYSMPRGGTALYFDSAYQSSSPRPILAQKFLEWDLTKERRFATLPSWFRNLLPEGWLRRYVAATPDGRDDELGLLGRLGGDLPGAVEVLPVEQTVEGEPRRAVDHVERLPQPRGSVIRFSLAGAQPKMSVDRGERVTMPVSGRGGRWILKMEDPEHPGLTLLEYSMMRWAGAVGIDVPQVDLVDADGVDEPLRSMVPEGTKAYLCRRFDRTEEGSRVHIEDLAQVLGIMPEDKYGETGPIGYVQVGRLLRQITGTSSAMELVRRLAFDVVCGNGDGHLKNFSILYVDPQRARLSPAYDLVSTVAYPRRYRPVLALMFPGGDEMASITVDRFRELGKRIGLDADLAEQAVRSLVQAALHAWRELADDLPLLDAHRRLIQQHLRNLPLARP